MYSEEGSETPETPVQLRNRELALPHRARATGLTATPRLLALVRMGEECKRRRRVGGTINNDRYRRMLVLVLVLVLRMVVVVVIVEGRRWKMCGDRGRAADIGLVRLRTGGQVRDERRHASGGIRD